MRIARLEAGALRCRGKGRGIRIGSIEIGGRLRRKKKRDRGGEVKEGTTYIESWPGWLGKDTTCDVEDWVMTRKPHII